MSDKKKDEKPKEAPAKELKKVVIKRKPKHFYVKPFKTSKKEYKVGDPCFEEHPKVIEYLLTKKIIK